jgi:hypothetical protein
MKSQKKIGCFVMLGFVSFMFLVIGGNNVLQAQSQIGQGATPDFILGNGTGAPITEIEIKPSKKKYGGNKNVFAYKDINVSDMANLSVFLPENMKSLDSFDIILKYGKGRAKTKKSLVIDKTGKNNYFVAKIKGKDSSIPLITGGVGAGATTVGIGVVAIGLKTGAIAIGQAVGAAALTEALVVIGGSIVGGLMVVAAAPVVVGGAIFGGIMLFTAKELEIIKIDFVVP